MIGRSASLNQSPERSPKSSMKRPSAVTGLRTGRPCFWPVAKSSMPKAGAVWTMPVPSSVVT